MTTTYSARLRIDTQTGEPDGWIAIVAEADIDGRTARAVQEMPSLALLDRPVAVTLLRDVQARLDAALEQLKAAW